MTRWTADPADRWQEPSTLLAQWAGVLLGPAAWALHLQASYLLATFACEDVWRLMLHSTALLTLAVALAGAWIARGNWRVSRDGGPEGLRLDRSRFMAISGIVLSLFFAVVIVAQWIPTLFIEPCRY